jgi:hypothetical protein
MVALVLPFARGAVAVAALAAAASVLFAVNIDQNVDDSVLQVLTDAEAP